MKQPIRAVRSERNNFEKEPKKTAQVMTNVALI